MNENPHDIEVGLVSNGTRYSNKKMRKRKHLDALIKFRSTKRNSNEIFRSSEDELFLPHQTTIQRTKTRSSLFDFCRSYSKQIVSFSLISIFIIVCIGLISTNIQLKNQVDRLSVRIDEIENKVPNVDIRNLSSIIEQFQIRLNFLEHWKNLFKTRLNQRQLDEQSQTSNRLDNILNDKIQQWNQQLVAFRHEIENLNQNTQIEQLNNFVHNSSDKTSVILNELQSNLHQLKVQIDQCKCSIEDRNSIDSSVIKPVSTLGKTGRQYLFDDRTKHFIDKTDIEQIVN